MAPKKAVAGLRRVGVRWVNDSLNMDSLSSWTDAILEEFKTGKALPHNPTLHCLQRAAINAQPLANKLASTLQMPDADAEARIHELATEGNKAACLAVEAADALLAADGVRRQRCSEALGPFDCPDAHLPSE